MKIIFCTGLVLLVNSLIASCRTVEYSVKNSKEINLCKLFPKIKCPEQKELFLEENNNVKIDIPEKPITDSPICGTCKNQVLSLEMYMDKSQTPEDIQKRFLAICDVLKQNLQRECYNFYTGVGLEMIKAMFRNEDPEKVCQMGKFCPSIDFSLQLMTIFKLMSSIILPKSTDNCDYCVQSFTYVENIIDVTKTPQQVQQSLIQYCGIIIEPFKQNCINVYSSPPVLDVITGILKQVNPRTICQHIHICPATHVHLRQQKIHQTLIVDSPTCDMCKSEVSSLEMYVNKSETPEDIQKHLLKVCDVLKQNVKTQCYSFLTGVGFEMIKAILKNEDPEKVCQIGNFCSQNSVKDQNLKYFKLVSSFMSNKLTDNCDSCTQIVSQIENVIDITKTPQQVQQSLIQVCGILIEPAKEGCVYSYSSPVTLEVITNILKQVNPRNICQDIHVCPPDHVLSNIQKIHQTLIVDSPTCDICKSQVRGLEMYVNKSETPEDIQKHFLKICDVLKQNVKTQCYSFFTGVGFEMIEAILKNEDPEKVCQIGNFCSSNSVKDHNLKYFKLVSSFMSNKLTDNCDSCTQIVSQIENVIDLTKTPQQVQQSLIQVCGILIEPVKEGCVYSYSSPVTLEVITNILKQVNPRNICQDIHVCPPDHVLSNIQSTYQTNLVDLPVCDICKRQVEALEMFVDKSKTPVEIQKTAFKICDILKENVKNQCYSFYSSTGFEMIKAILKNENPAKVCLMGHFCSANVDSVRYITLLKHLSHLMSRKLSDQCADCVERVHYFEIIIDSSKTPQQIQQTMIQYCDIFVESVNQYCKNIYSSPAALALITDILNQKDPKTVCQEIHECTKKYFQIRPKIAPKKPLFFLPKTSYGSD